MKLVNKKRANAVIREALAFKGMKHWQLAIKLGVCEQTLVRWMREPLPKDMEQKIMGIIKDWNSIKEDQEAVSS